MKPVSRTNRRYLLAGVVLMLLFGALQLAELVWNKLSPPPSEVAVDDVSPRQAELPVPVRPEVRVEGDTITIDVSGHKTTIGFGGDPSPELESLETCLNDRLRQAWADDGADGARRDETVPLFKGFRDRAQINERVNAVIRDCVEETERRQPGSRPSDS